MFGRYPETAVHNPTSSDVRVRHHGDLLSASPTGCARVTPSSPVRRLDVERTVIAQPAARSTSGFDGDDVDGEIIASRVLATRVGPLQPWVRRGVAPTRTCHVSSVEGVVAAAMRGVPALELVERANGRAVVLRAALASVSALENSDAAQRLERALQWIRPTAGALT